jgi:3'-phosphoadenosine 5'-phosphosulfate sulfotransferase (PAPS reductase)/FAD synthetase|tara:strand:+ start:186 stop:986 length:801 start_codon:yes stop_codon:yes gene_type:complete
MRTFSFGGGVQSTAVLVLQAENRLPEPYDVFLFANVGDDSEHPATIDYFNNVHKPYAEKHGIRLIEIKRVKRDGTSPTLLKHLKTQERSIDIPVHIGHGGPSNRNCTATYKIHVVRKWQRQNGSSRENPAVCGLGISVDEIQRARTESGFPDQTLEYPLIDLGLRRSDCVTIHNEAGLPTVPRSACWFCPFHNKEGWRRTKRHNPELFQQAVELERMLGDRAVELGKDRSYLSRYRKPLDQAIEDQLTLDGFDDGPDSCDSGSCFT